VLSIEVPCRQARVRLFNGLESPSKRYQLFSVTQTASHSFPPVHLLPIERVRLCVMNQNLGKNLALGAAAGAAGTAFIQGMMAGSKRRALQTLPPMKEEPGAFMMKKAERLLPRKTRRQIPDNARSIAGSLLAFCYGMTFGSIYAALRPRDAKVIRDGAALGTAAWAAGYLGWLPATKLTPPVLKQKPKQIIPNILTDIIFGVATVALFKQVKKRF